MDDEYKMHVEEEEVVNHRRNGNHVTSWASKDTSLPIADDRGALSYDQSRPISPTSSQSSCRCKGSDASGPSSAIGGGGMGDFSAEMTTRAKLSLEMLGSELVCAICQQLFVEAATVECGHSFCRMCIDSWLKSKLTCPICRQNISKPPIGSLCLDKAVRAMLDIAQERETERELMERKKQATQVRENECIAQTCLETLFQRAIQQGVRVVHISRRWSPREQRRFLDGIERHQGVAREAYCKVVGLTYDWIGRATTEELIVAATNVNLNDVTAPPVPPSTCAWNKDKCIRRLRARLEMYIRYG